MRSLAQVRGVMVLRTCNRVTIYVDAPTQADPHALKDAVERELAQASHTPREDVQLRHLWGHDGLVDLSRRHPGWSPWSSASARSPGRCAEPRALPGRMGP